MCVMWTLPSNGKQTKIETSSEIPKKELNSLCVFLLFFPSQSLTSSRTLFSVSFYPHRFTCTDSKNIVHICSIPTFCNIIRIPDLWSLPFSSSLSPAFKTERETFSHAISKLNECEPNAADRCISWAIKMWMLYGNGMKINKVRNAGGDNNITNQPLHIPTNV